MIWCGHHFQFQVAKFLWNWKPKFQLSQETEELVANFVGTRAQYFADKTVEYEKRISRGQAPVPKKKGGLSRHNSKRFKNKY